MSINGKGPDELNKDNLKNWPKDNLDLGPGPQKDFSLKSSISSLTQDKQTEDKRSAVLRLVDDVNQQRQEIDKLNQSMSYLAEKTQEIAGATDKIIKLINGGQLRQEGGAPQQDQAANIQMLGNLAEQLAPIWKMIKGNAEGPAPLIDQEMINTKMKESFMGNLETGESINKFIKDSLKKSVTRTIINSSLKDIGNSNNEQHGPA